MNKPSFYILALFATCVLFLTGCPHAYSTTNQQNNAVETDSIVVKGSISAPSAMSENSRMAISSFTQDKNGNSSVCIITATATIDGEKREISNQLNIAVTSYFNLTLPKIEAAWSISVQMLVNENVVMTSQVQTLNVDALQPTYDIQEKFYLTLTEQSDPSQNKGSIRLTVKKDPDSTIQKIKWQLKPLGTTTQTQPIVFTNDPVFNEQTFKAVLDESDIPAGTYEAYLSFIDSYGMLYGPVIEVITVNPGFVTDTWYSPNQDVFIQFSNEEVKELFIVPSDSRLLDFFPDPCYSQSITDNVVLMWNYNPQTFKPSYTVHTLDATGLANEDGIPLARGKNIRDVFPDFSNNDMYVLSAENTIYKYIASSGYSEFKVNHVENSIILSVCANNGDAYVLVFNPAAQVMNPEEKYILYKFDDSSNYMEEIGYVPLTYADFSQYSDTFKMALCDNFLFVAYNYSVNGQEEGFCCAAFDVTITSGNNLKTCWLGGTEYQLYYSDIGSFENNNFRINDIVAVYNGVDTVAITNRKIKAYDIYALLGNVSIVSGMGELDPDYGSSYGGIIKISTKEEGDNNYQPYFDTDYDYRYLYKATEMSSFYCNNSDANLYNPIKFIGKSSNKYIIADDGADISSQYDGKNKIWFCSSVNSVNRVVNVDITSESAEILSSQTVNADFDYYTTETVFFNYKKMAANGQQMGSTSVFTDIEADSSNIVLADGVTVELYKKNKYGYFESMSTEILPAKRGESLYFRTTPELSNATYQAVLYCNGKDLNKDSNGNLLSEDEQYYYIDSQAGTLTLNKPLPCIGYEYQLEIDVINQFDVEGETTTIHNDVTMEVFPATEFEIRFPATLQKFYALLDNFLISDYAIVKAINNPFIVDDYEGFGYEKEQYHVSDFVNDIVSYFNEHPCDCLTLDFSDPDMTGLTEITSGMFAIDCSGIKLPDINGMSIKNGAFYNDSRIFKGDLELSYNVSEIESGAFAIPPRSIVLSGSSSNPNIYLTKVKDSDAKENMLIRMPNWTTKGVITCTKRDEPFEIDLSQYPSLEDIHANAFRGLPVTNVELGTLTVNIGDNAFKDTPVEGTF